MIKEQIEKSEFLINIARFIYRKTFLKYKYYKQNRVFLSNAKEVMYAIDNIFRELNIPYWLEYGTLLGVIRDNDFIKHDIDIDLGLFLKDYSQNIEKTFIKYGFKKLRKISIDNDKYGIEETYTYNGMEIDLFFYTKKGDYMFAHAFQKEEGKTWKQTLKENGGYIVREIYLPYTGIDKIKFLGKYFPVPKDYHKHLSIHYGSDYMKPNPKWNPDMATNVKILQDKIGVVYDGRQ